MRRMLLVALVGAFTLALAGCGDDDAGTVREYDLTAEVVDWEVVDGEVVEVWGYNGDHTDASDRDRGRRSGRGVGIQR